MRFHCGSPEMKELLLSRMLRDLHAFAGGLGEPVLRRSVLCALLGACLFVLSARAAPLGPGEGDVVTTIFGGQDLTCEVIDGLALHGVT